jgi:hypothetical protein
MRKSGAVARGGPTQQHSNNNSQPPSTMSDVSARLSSGSLSGTAAVTAPNAEGETDPSPNAGDVGGQEGQLAMYSPEVRQQVLLQLADQQRAATDAAQAAAVEETEGYLTAQTSSDEVNRCVTVAKPFAKSALMIILQLYIRRG